MKSGDKKILIIGISIIFIIAISFSIHYSISSENINDEEWTKSHYIENASFLDTLNNEMIPKKIETSMKEENLPLFSPEISVETEDKVWRIDTEDTEYLLVRDEDKIKIKHQFTIIATANNLGYFAEELLGDKINVHSIVPAGQCPGQFDTTPKDVEAAERADLLLWNGLEEWLEDLIQTSSNENLTKNRSPDAPWGPVWGAEMHIENIADSIVKTFPFFETHIRERENELISSLRNTGENLVKRVKEENLENTKVISQQFQAAFMEWLGFDVIDTYVSAEKSISEMEDLLELADEENVKLIISNKPSGTEVGESIEERANINHVILNNFPNVLDGETHSDLIEKNTEVIIDSLKD